MKRITFISTVSIAVISFILMLIASCNRDMARKIEVDSEFATYISGYTSGVISNKSKLVIELTEDLNPEFKADQLITEKLFKLEPEVEGEAYWTNARTIEFRPKGILKPSTEYTVTFNLDKIKDVPRKFEEFVFQFRTRTQSIDIYTDGLSTYDPNNLKRQKIEGDFVLADFADTFFIHKALFATQEGKNLKMEWNHSHGNKHHFVIHDIARKENASAVLLNWNGLILGTISQGEKKLDVPALGDFKITDIYVNQSPEQYVVIHYSDPLLAQQSLEGLITIQDSYRINFVIEGHKVLAYPSSRLAGEKLVSVFRGVKNIHGYGCKNEDGLILNFEELKPAVRLIGEGVIVPTSDKGMLFPFEAVNLKAVDISIIKIYENNVTHFLQVNDLTGTSDLRRVGKEIVKKKIELDPKGKSNLHDWNQFTIDLGEIVKTEPGAIYHVKINFKKDYSLYTCSGISSSSKSLTKLESSKEDEGWNEKGWGSYYSDDYYYSDYDYDDYYYDYNYSEREDPCKSSYYYNKGVERNVLISDIGIIAKAGSDKIMNIYLSDLRTTRAIAGASVEFFDYQSQLLGRVNTDEKGSASIRLNDKPFVLIAKKGNQTGYLRLRDGEALSLSKFDVEGERVQRGVKGFIYTERGVWRPGDSIYVSFMLEDKENILPANHPVSMELINPQGVVVKTAVTSKNLNGVYDFRTSTSMDDPTGYYTVNVNVGNRRFTKSLRIETVKPNRLKIYLDFGKEMLSVADRDKTVRLNSKWLHGAPAKNLKSKVEVSVNSIYTTFKGYGDYNFEDPTRSYSSEDQVVFDGQLDETGNAVFDANIEVGDAAPGLLKAYFTTRVFEEGGGFSIDRSSVKYSPYSSYVGIKVPQGDKYSGTLVTDEDHVIDVATVDANGKPVSRTNLEVKVYEIRWRYWWDNYDNDLSSYIGNNSATPILNTTINTVNGKGKFNLRVNRPSWGRYLIYVKDNVSGHASGKVVYIDWPYWARSNRKDNENATMLSFSTDKSSYATGEMVQVSFPSSANSRALVSIESGIKVIDHFWIDTKAGETKFEFKTNKQMTPNCYVSITLLQPHSITANDLPLRLYGVIPINVENPESHLHPIVSAPEVIRPESKTTVTVREQKGRAMTYTVAMVDEGLLDLTGFKTPDPWTAFNAREALGVKTWDMYDQVMGAFTAKMDKLLAIGGDGEGDGKKGARANRFKPMVHFSGPYHIKPFGVGVHRIDIPNYVGSVRIMVIAREEESYGHTEKTVAVRNPLMVLGTLPRVLGPGELVQLPVDVFAMEKHVKNVSLEIQTNDMLIPKSGTKKSIAFSDIGDEVVNFELAVAEKLGVGKVNIIARSGKEIAKYEIEIDVRSPNPKVTDIQEVVLDAGKEWNPNFAFNGMDGTNKVTLEVSSIPSINLEYRLKYLITYPHGCIEQTTSSVFPQLYLSNIMELDNNFKSAISANIKEAIDRIQLFQTNDGGFSYWPGMSSSNEWGTSYAGHFLLEAESKGYRIPSNLKSNWIKYQQKMARNWRSNSSSSNYGFQQYTDIEQAYRLYTLALAKSPEIGAMNRLRESSNISVAARWRLASAYQLSGQSDVAAKLISGASTSVPAYRELSYSFGNDVRDKAMILEALVLMKQKAKAANVLKDIAREMNTKSWMSTQTTAYCLLAIGKFLGDSPNDKSMKFTYSLNGSSPITKNSLMPVYKHELDVRKLSKSGKLQLKNNGASILYAKLVLEGIPAVGDQSSASNNISLAVRYTDMKGEPIDVGRLEQGTDFIAEVSLTNPGTRGYLAEMALTQIFPSGWEIHNTRMDDFQTAALQSDYATYQDIRDDRIYSYYNMAANQSKVFRFKLNASYLGKYYLPTISTEAMYDNTINARIPGRWIYVVKQGEKISL